MKKVILAILGFLLLPTIVLAAFPPQTVQQGGTGWGAVQSGALLYGDPSSLLRLATTTQGTPGQILAWLSGIPTWTATTTNSCSGTGLSCTYANGLWSFIGTGGGIGDPFTHTTNFGQTVSATTTPVWFQGGLQSSSTIQTTGINVDAFGSYMQEGVSILSASSSQKGIYVGYSAGAASTSNAGFTTAVGYQAAPLLTTASNLTSIGYQSLLSATSSLRSTAVGAQALLHQQGNDNTGVGYLSMGSANSSYGSFNTGIGGQTLSFVTGDNNTAVGYQAGVQNSIGSGNTTLGYRAGDHISSGSANIAIGQNIEEPSNTASGQLNIGNLIYGTGLYSGSSLSSTAVSGSGIAVGIATSSPWGFLSVNANGIGTGPQFVIGSSTGTNFIVTSGGKVGVGTTNPQALFSVNGTASTTNLNVSGVPSALFVTDSSGAVGAYGGTSCTNQFIRSLSALGAGGCATVANTDLANSSLTVTAGGGLIGGGSVALGSSVTLTAQVGTSSVPNIGGLAYWTGNGTPSTLGTVATGTETCTSISGVSCSSFNVIGSGGAISLSAIPNSSLANSSISGVALGGTLFSLSHNATFSGTSYNGSATLSDWGINLANGNTWTGLQQLNGGASSTGEISAASASSTNLIVSGIQSALIKTAADGTASAYGGTTCTNQFLRSLSALAAGGCATVSLVNDITGVLGLSNGGTATSTWSHNGGVVFYDNVLGTLSQAATQAAFFFDKINNRLGIGTSTPQWPLHLAGTQPSFAISDSSAGANLKHWLLSSMGGNLYIGTSTDAFATSTPAALSINNNGAILAPYGIATSTSGASNKQFLARITNIYSTTTPGTSVSLVLTGAKYTAPSFSAGTLTLPSNTAYFIVELWGSGGGGGGGGADGLGSCDPTCSGSNGTAGSSSNFNSGATAAGGGGGDGAFANGYDGGAGGAGGTASSGDLNAPGYAGGTGLSSVAPNAGTGGSGGGTGGGRGNSNVGGNGNAGSTCGGGGAGGSGNAAAVPDGDGGGGGGASGGYVRKLVVNPSGSYTYTLGAGGAGGAGGTRGAVTGGSGGAGAAACMTVTVYTY